MDLTLPGTLHTSEQFFRSSAKHTAPDCPPKKKRELELSCWLLNKSYKHEKGHLLLVHDQGAEHYLVNCAILSVGAHLGETAVSSPNTNGAPLVSGDHPGAILAEGDDGERRLVEHLVLSSHPLVLVPEGHATVRPADGQRLEYWMPLQAHWLSLTALDLKVGDGDALLIHENDAGLICSDGQDHVEVVVAPSRRDRRKAVRERIMAIKE
jgi:hypothetical protein